LTSSMTVAEQWEQLWLPVFPLASDDLRAGVYRERRPGALRRKYIEANPHALSNLLVVDIDHADALTRALWGRQDWLPNAVVENPANGHAHAVWALREPITRTEYARRKPIALGAAVVEGLRRSVDGDAGYSGLITKNPTHDAWEPHWITDELRSLGQLQEHLEDAGFMPSASWKRSKRRNQVGLGQNCSIFESARTWAYRELRHYFGAPQMYADAVLAHVLELNAEFPEPLPYSEAKAIASSISRWVITKSRMWADGPVVYEATFSTIQSARGRRSGAPRIEATRQALWEELS
jgi:hypothetical protein